ncbi:hypothetical protein JXQ70_10160 [bacterium]|nr:hypothetical protein [bacterium]
MRTRTHKLKAIRIIASLCLLLLALPLCCRAEIERWGVGCPLGKFSIFINDEGQFQSGYTYDINYTLRMNRFLNLEFGLGAFLQNRPISSADNDQATLTGQVTIFQISNQFELFRTERHLTYLGLGCEYAHIEPSQDSSQAFFFADSPPGSIVQFDIQPIDTVGPLFILGYEFSIHETLSFVMSVGYRTMDFVLFARWQEETQSDLAGRARAGGIGCETGPDPIECSEHSEDLEFVGYSVSLGLKAYFPLE